MAENLALVMEIKFGENNRTNLLNFFNNMQKKKKCKKVKLPSGIEPTNEKDITRRLDVFLTTRPFLQLSYHFPNRLTYTKEKFAKLNRL